MITAAHCSDEINHPPDAEIQSQILRTAIQSLTVHIIRYCIKIYIDVPNFNYIKLFVRFNL